MQNNTTFETGATSAAVNELILYTDNTRELAAHRDAIYELHSYTPIAPNAISFMSLLDKAEDKYADELGNRPILTLIQDQEYCQIYANRFAEWKKERERNSK